MRRSTEPSSKIDGQCPACIRLDELNNLNAKLAEIISPYHWERDEAEILMAREEATSDNAELERKMNEGRPRWGKFEDGPEREYLRRYLVQRKPM